MTNSVRVHRKATLTPKKASHGCMNEKFTEAEGTRHVYTQPPLGPSSSLTQLEGSMPVFICLRPCSEKLVPVALNSRELGATPSVVHAQPKYAIVAAASPKLGSEG